MGGGFWLVRGVVDLEWNGQRWHPFSGMLFFPSLRKRLEEIGQLHWVAPTPPRRCTHFLG